jgi:protocatechuate 3,4-dioxygenase beta subunit
MDTDDQMVGRILSRREALWAATRAGLAVAAGSVMARSTAAQTRPTTRPAPPLVASPTLTEGPFFVDERLNRSDLIGDTTRASVINGTPLLLSFVVYKLTGKTYAPLKDAQFDVWHADTVGVYSDENHPMNHENTAQQRWLRGYQISDADGVVTFKTIVPGWYENRTAHIHVKVRQFNAEHRTTAEFTSQVFFREADSTRIFSKPPYNTRRDERMRNLDDMVYMDSQIDGRPAGDYLLLDLTPNTDGGGYRSTFAIALTDASMHEGERRPFGGPGGPPPPGGRPPRGGPPPW